MSAAGDGRTDGWQRLDPRMLLVYPVRELVRFLPVVVGVLVAGTASGRADWWHVLGIGVPVALGLARYLTTTYRIGAERVELRRGLLNRHLLSTPRDRVRTVDLTATPAHRVVGLVTVRIGTGTASTDSDDEISLDGLPVVRARALRSELLRLDAPTTAADLPVTPDPAVLRLDPRWARYGPLTGSGIVVAAGIAGAASQVVNAIVGRWVDAVDAVVGAAGSSPALALPLVVLAAAVAIAVIVVLSVIGYLVTNWDFALTHTGSAGHGAWHVRRGLLTTRETSLDDVRVRGVTVGEPLGLRLAGAARASAIATGVPGEASETAPLAPPAPRDVVLATVGRVLGTEAPSAPLIDHGRRARRRRWSRALLPTVALLAVVVVAVVAASLPVWVLTPAPVVLVAVVLLARDRAAGLGHALVDGHFVTQSGSLTREREVLQTTAVIGWTLRASWPQRRAGLVSLVATTAGGSQSVTALDVPEDAAVAVGHDALPDLVAQFLVEPGVVSPETSTTAFTQPSL